MSSDIAVSVRGLSKCYQIYEKPHHRLLQMMLGRMGSRKYYQEFWALQDISFEVGKGKVVGILGKNGAGKSTLLQVLCGTTAPTGGAAEVSGRLAALLELGAGFNPEFTGIENVYMNGQILGLTRLQLDEKLADIQKFADIGDFIHQPVKTYSSGMFARLAFSVAVHVDPDVLVVDEALSVGDSWFQHKSMARMRQLMSKGCTVLFVSHAIDSVRALCDEAIWIDAGRIKMHGDVTSVTNEYMNEIFIEHNRITLESLASMDAEVTPSVSSNAPSEGDEDRAEDHDQHELLKAIQGANGGTVLKVVSISIRNSKGEVTDRLEQGEGFSLEFEVQFLTAVKNISLGFLIKDQFGQELTGESVFNTYRHSLDFEAGRTVRFAFSSTMMFRGGQSYSVALRINQVTKWDRSDNVIVYADELATVFDVLSDHDNPMWFKFKQPFDVAVYQ
jgi:lipopolysaccharide transport system ATP-binding protein